MLQWWRKGVTFLFPDSSGRPATVNGAGIDGKKLSMSCKYGFYTCEFKKQPEMCAICTDGDNYQE